MARVYLSSDVNEYLRQVEHISGMRGKELIETACEYCSTYMAGYNQSSAVPQSNARRRSISSQAMLTIMKYAELTETKPGQAMDYLLRQFLPTVVHDQKTRQRVAKSRVVVQVHPMVLTMFHEVKANDDTGEYMKVQDYLWSLTNELPDQILAELMDKGASVYKNYVGVPYTSMVCPRRVYTLLSVASEQYRVPKAGLFSAFLVELVRWYKKAELFSAVAFPEPSAILGGKPFDEDSLSVVLKHMFSLGYNKGAQG